MVEKETRALRIKCKGSPPDGALSFRVDEKEAHPPHLTDKGEVVLTSSRSTGRPGQY